MIVEANKVEELSSMANEVLDAILPDIEGHSLWAVEFVKKHGGQIARAAGDEEKAADWEECFAAGELPGSDETAVEGGGIIARARTRSQHRRSAKEREQVVADARRDAVQMSAYMAKAEEFKENRDKEEAVGMAPRGVLASSGCFVLMTMPSGWSKDFADYKDVYVGAGFPLSTAVYDQLVGDGDPDIYADFKYGQSVQMLLYPCGRDDVELLRASLIVDFQAFDSYNAREIRHSLTQGEDEASAVSVAEEAWEAAVAAVEEAEEEAASAAAAKAEAEVKAAAQAEAAELAEAVEAAGVAAVEIAAAQSAQMEADRSKKEPAQAEAAELAEAAPVSSAPASADATMVLGGVKPIQASSVAFPEEDDEAEHGKHGHRGRKSPANIHLASGAREQIYAQAAATPEATVLLGAVPPASAARGSQPARPVQAASQGGGPSAGEDGGAGARDTSGFDVLWSEEPQVAPQEESQPQSAASAPVAVPPSRSGSGAKPQGAVPQPAEESQPQPARDLDTSGFDVLWSEEPQDEEEDEGPRIMNVPHVGAAEDDLQEQIKRVGGGADPSQGGYSESFSTTLERMQMDDPWDEDAFDEGLLEEAPGDDASEEKDA